MKHEKKHEKPHKLLVDLDFQLIMFPNSCYLSISNNQVFLISLLSTVSKGYIT